MKKVKQMLLLALSVMTLTACSINKKPSETQYLAPIVMCNESKSASEIPQVPLMSKDEYVSLQSDAEKIQYLTKHIASYQMWAVQAIGKVKERDYLRKNTADCLDKLRTEGVIK